MITTSSNPGDVTEERTFFRNSGAMSPASTIDSAVVSRVRRALFRDKSKHRSLTISRHVELTCSPPREKPHRMDHSGTTSASSRSLHILSKEVVGTSPRRGPFDETEVPRRARSCPSQFVPFKAFTHEISFVCAKSYPQWNDWGGYVIRICLLPDCRPFSSSI